MATVIEIRARLRAGEVVIMPAECMSVFLRECAAFPGTERYKIEPHAPGYSKIYDPDGVEYASRIKVKE